MAPQKFGFVRMTLEAKQSNEKGRERGREATV